MKTETYIEYLETLVLSLLTERNSDNDIVATDTENPCYKGCTFSPMLAKRSILEHQFNNYKNTIIGTTFPADKYGTEFRVIRADKNKIGVVLIKDGKELPAVEISKKAFEAMRKI